MFKKSDTPRASSGLVGIVSLVSGSEFDIVV